MADCRKYAKNILGFLLVSVPWTSVILSENLSGLLLWLSTSAVWSASILLVYCNLKKSGKHYFQSYTSTLNCSKVCKFNMRKLTFFYFSIFCSMAICLTLLRKDVPFHGEFPWPSMLLGIFSGPFLIFFITKLKGIYKSCCFLIFLGETVMLCLGLYHHMNYALICGIFMLGILMTSTSVLIPFSIYYFFGVYDFGKSVSSLAKASLWGLLPGSFIPLFLKEYFSFEQLSMAAVLLLLCSFFALFSAWNHRFVLLK